MKKKYFSRFSGFAKIILTISFLICAGSNLEAQMIYMPDSNFRHTLMNQGYLSCIIGDSIDASCPLVINTTALYLNTSNISDLEGILAFGNLQALICGNNNFSTIPSLPASLKRLYCAVGHISSIASLPSSLTWLNCSDNQLASLPTLPVSLDTLFCNSNQLTNLPSLSDSLRWFSCDNNQLTNVPFLPASLRSFSCDNNQLTSLPPLPTSLRYLQCAGNQLTSLPSLPNSLIELYCSHNQLTNLPSLSSSLQSIFCAQNQLTNLPVLPTSLFLLNCLANQLTSLPSLPSSLTTLVCDSNQLTTIPELPDSLYNFICYNNPNLTCLPQLKRIVNLNFSNTMVSCIPNYGRVTNSVPSLNSLPLCGSYNPHACSNFADISGKCYYDENANCLYDSADIRQQNMHILLYKNGNLVQQEFTNADGLYSFYLNDSGGAYRVRLDTSNISFTVLCPANIYYDDTISVADSLFYNNDFSIECNTVFDIGVWSIEGGVRPAHHTQVHIKVGDIANFYGAQCANGIGGIVTVVFSGPISYYGPAPGALTPTNVSGDSLTYNIADFGSLNFLNAFNILVYTDPSAVIGSKICFTVNVSTPPGDNNPANNTLRHCFVVSASYDPNEKEVYPVDFLDSTDQWLTYTIHFQNTGTASAEHIYITDTLDANFDLSTFQLLAYSHQPLVQILNGGIARFNFPNINLPDSNSNEPESHGYIQYKIKLKNGLPPGTEIRNTGYIYFDFNSPVVTNTTLNTLILPTGITTVTNGELQFSVFPNPSHNEFTVSCLHFNIGKKITLKIFNALGEELLFSEMHSATITLPTSGLSSGIYFLPIETEEGMVVRKLVKD